MSFSVLHIVPAKFGEAGVFGGAERYAYLLATMMSASARTEMLAFGKQASSEMHGSLRVTTVRRQGGQTNNAFAFSLLPKVLSADVIHVHQTHTYAASLAVAIGKVTSKPVFTTDLGGGGRCLQNYWDVRDWYAGHLHISEYSRRTFGHEARRNAAVIYGGVDASYFVPPTIRPRETFSVLFVGRLLPHKGVDVLIKAAGRDIELVVAGRIFDAAYYQYLQQLAERKRVRFCHDLDDVQLLAAYQGASCIVLPSVYTSSYDGSKTTVPELLGQTLLEGMACGLPAICSDVASMPEIVQDGVTGFITPANDVAALRARLLELRENTELRERMGKAGRQRVLDHFTWSQVVDRCLAHYRAALGRKA